jgi:hypothetical protein
MSQISSKGSTATDSAPKTPPLWLARSGDRFLRAEANIRLAMVYLQWGIRPTDDEVERLCHELTNDATWLGWMALYAESDDQP